MIFESLLKTSVTGLYYGTERSVLGRCGSYVQRIDGNGRSAYSVEVLFVMPCRLHTESR